MIVGKAECNRRQNSEQCRDHAEPDADRKIPQRSLAPRESRISELARFENGHRQRRGDGRCHQRRHRQGNHLAAHYLPDRDQNVEQRAVEKVTGSRTDQRPERVAPWLPGALHYLTCTPFGATSASSTSTPATPFSAIVTLFFAPGSTRKTTQPPPPAPQTFAPVLPARRAVVTS